MSGKRAKADRKAAEADNLMYEIIIRVNKDGGFEMEVPKGSPIPLTMDVLMRAQGQVWNTFMNTLKAQQATQRAVQPVSGIPEGLLRREPS